jgi:hypothetical protein
MLFLLTLKSQFLLHMMRTQENQLFIYGIERIRDLQLLRELVNYRPKKEYEKGNYDAICSFGLALLHAKNNEVLGVIPEDTKENVNFNQKNAKLMLRSRFSHTNLKKLSNANNI